MAIVLRSKGIDLAPKRRECVSYGDLSMLVACVIRSCLVDDDVLVRRNRQPDVDLKPDAVAMLVAGCDHLDAATCNPVIMGFQPPDLAQYLGSGSVR